MAGSVVLSDGVRGVIEAKIGMCVVGALKRENGCLAPISQDMTAFTPEGEGLRRELVAGLKASNTSVNSLPTVAVELKRQGNLEAANIAYSTYCMLEEPYDKQYIWPWMKVLLLAKDFEGAAVLLSYLHAFNVRFNLLRVAEGESLDEYLMWGSKPPLSFDEYDAAAYLRQVSDRQFASRAEVEEAIRAYGGSAYWNLHFSLSEGEYEQFQKAFGFSNRSARSGVMDLLNSSLGGSSGKLDYVDLGVKLCEFAIDASDGSTHHERSSIEALKSSIYPELKSKRGTAVETAEGLGMLSVACSVILSALDGSNEDEKAVCEAARGTLKGLQGIIDMMGGGMKIPIPSYGDPVQTIPKPTAGSSKPVSQSSSGGCYVATAVYGSYDCPQVWTLRRFRDFRLAKSIGGRMFIRTYYAISPSLVKRFGDIVWLKKLLRRPLDSLVGWCRNEGYSSEPYEDPSW